MIAIEGKVKYWNVGNEKLTGEFEIIDCYSDEDIENQLDAEIGSLLPDNTSLDFNDDKVFVNGYYLGGYQIIKSDKCIHCDGTGKLNKEMVK